MNNPDCLVYTVPEAGAILGLTRNRAYAAVKNGQLPTLKIGKLLRVPKVAVHAIRDGIPYASAPPPAKKPLGRPRKFPDNRISLSFRVTLKIYNVLVARREKSGRSLSEEIEMILEKAFFPMDAKVASEIRGRLCIDPEVCVPAEPSLKGLLPRLAAIFDFTEVSLYERQRELVRLGLLPKPTGIGPRGGTPASREAVSVLIAAAVILSDRIRDIKTMDKQTILDVAEKIRDAMASGTPLSHVRDEAAPLRLTVTISAGAMIEVEGLVTLGATSQKSSQTSEVDLT
jgi:excisionase family DNA binding protein